MFNKVVVANRGAVAARVLRALYEMRIKAVAIYSEADYGAPYLEMAAETYAIGAAPARDSYLNQDLLLDVFKRAGVDGVHPGYGFLSENAAIRAARDRRGRALYRPFAEVDRRDGAQDARARNRRAIRHAHVEGLGRAADGARGDPRGRTRDRLPGAGQAGGRRRRHRHAAGQG